MELYEKMETIRLKAFERGYVLHAQSGDYSFSIYHNDETKLGLKVYTKTEHFEIISIHKLDIKLTTEEVGSFFSDEHFKKFEERMIDYTRLLKHQEAIESTYYPE